MRSFLITLALVAVSATVCAQTRPYLMSSTASQAVPGQPLLYQQDTASFPLQSLANDVDVISIFAEHLGLPIELFYTAQAPPPNHPWTIEITRLATAAKNTGKPVMLQLALTREYVVSKNYVEDGVLKLHRTWAPRCFDWSSSIGSWVGISYVNYVRWLTTLFDPEYVVVMAEINLFYAKCGGDTAAWRALVNIERAAYDAVKALKPDAPAFASFKLEELYGDKVDGFDTAQYEAMANVKRDRFGISTYPASLSLPNGFRITPYNLPADYLARVKHRYPLEKRLLIAETGWLGHSFNVHNQGTCYGPVVYTSAEFPVLYMQYLLYFAWLENVEVITWWSDRDLIEVKAMNTCYPPVAPGASSCAGDLWCLAMAQFQADYAAYWTPIESELIFKIFGAMGLRDYSGNARPVLMDLWQFFLALPPPA